MRKIAMLDASRWRRELHGVPEDLEDVRVLLQKIATGTDCALQNCSDDVLTSMRRGMEGLMGSLIKAYNFINEFLKATEDDDIEDGYEEDW